MADFKADFASLVQKRDEADGSGVECTMINSYGISCSEKELLIRESALLKPHRLHVFKSVINLLNKLQIKWYISDGSLLGWYRSRAMIPHDYDFDIAVKDEDLQKVWKGRHELPKDVVIDNTGSGDSTGCVWVTDEVSIPFDPASESAKKLAVYMTDLPPKPKEGPVFVWEACVDILSHRKESDGWHCNYNMNKLNASAIAFPDDVVFPLMKSEFEGIEVYVPNNPKRWLELNYGYLGEGAVWDTKTSMYKAPE